MVDVAAFASRRRTTGELDARRVGTSVRTSTTPHDVAGTVRYVLTEPVSIPRGVSTMVSIAVFVVYLTAGRWILTSVVGAEYESAWSSMVWAVRRRPARLSRHQPASRP